MHWHKVCSSTRQWQEQTHRQMLLLPAKYIFNTYRNAPAGSEHERAVAACSPGTCRDHKQSAAAALSCNCRRQQRRICVFSNGADLSSPLTCILLCLLLYDASATAQLPYSPPTQNFANCTNDLQLQLYGWIKSTARQ
jgi:hypothetical protein